MFGPARKTKAWCPDSTGNNVQSLVSMETKGPEAKDSNED